MAEKQDDILLNYDLKDDEISIAFELAVALRADEVDKFLELYDSIPINVEIKRVSGIKEMARQLAAFPKKQFDKYRPRGLLSGEHNFLVSSPTLNKDKLIPDHVNNTSSIKPKDLDIKDIILDISQNSIDMDEVTVTPTPKKKSKKKKKKKATVPTNQISNICNGDLPTSSEGEKDSHLCIENKLLDSHGSGSGVAAMNKTMVADNSDDSPACTFIKSNVASTSMKISDCTVDNSSDSDTKGIVIAENNSAENKKFTDAKDLNELDDISHHTAPPFGYPLSTDKLIQSAIKLLSFEPSKDINTQDQKFNDKETQVSTDSSSVISINSPIEIEISVDSNDSLKDTITPPEPNQLRNDGIKIDESIDGDISNLSAWEDEGWQVRRSHRKKKKELTARERSNSNHKNNKESHQENKQNSLKKQTPRNVHIRKINAKSNSPHRAKMASENSERKDNENDKNGSESDNSKSVDAQSNDDKEIINNSEGDSKAAFSYRDALLKAKPKNTEELQYNSDSGVDVNSIGSCDSAIHSPKIPNEFDLEEAVKFFKKGWDEVMELHKQGKVVYYSDNANPSPAHRNKKPFKKYWHPRPKHHK